MTELACLIGGLKFAALVAVILGVPALISRVVFGKDK